MGTQTDLAMIQRIGKKGAERSAAAISELIGNLVRIEVAAAAVIDPLALPTFLGSPEQAFTVGCVSLDGDIRGVLLVIYSTESRAYLTRQWSGRMGVKVDPDLEESCIAEVTNIIAANYGGGICSHVDGSIMPTPPTITCDMIGAILDEIAAVYAISAERVIVLDARFRTQAEREDLRAAILFLPAPGVLADVTGGVDAP